VAKGYVQWGRSQASDWEEFDSADWKHLPGKGVPATIDVPDSARGWINALNLYGVIFSGDHYAIEDLPNGAVRVYCWNDDPDDQDSSIFSARVVDLHPLQADPGMGGAINTKFTQTIYAGSGLSFNPQQNTTVLPWDQFSPPNQVLIRHGIWLPEQLYEDHNQVQTQHGWREWTDGLDAADIGPDGLVRAQRSLGRYIKPFGTQTFYASDTDLADDIHAADEEKAFLETTGTAQQVVSNKLDDTGEELFTFVTPSGKPNSAAWPTGNYRAQLDCVSFHADGEFGVLDLGSEQGHFARVNAAISSDLETKQQQESAFILTGLKLATTGSVSWTAGNASDRFEVLVCGRRTTGHASIYLTLELNEADDYADGPWEEIAADTNAPFFGANF
jgi:hypothetical protein